MKFSSTTRTVLIIAIVVILGAAGYVVFFKKSGTTSTGSLQTTQSSTPQAAGTAQPTVLPADQDFLTQLLNVQSIKLDQGIFSNQAFALLEDFNRPIPPDSDPGRANPFAPIGADAPSSATQISTSNPSSILPTSSTLNGTLSANDPSATRWFEYGNTQALGNLTAPKSQPTPGSFAETISGLIPNTTYYVRAGAQVGGRTIEGNIVTWKTAQSSTKR